MITRLIYGLPAMAWALLAIATAVIGPTLIGIFSLPLAPVLAGVAVYRARKEESMFLYFGSIALLVLMLFFAFYLFLGTQPSAITTVIEG
jgi:type IV secretory pathway TrbL component